MNCEKRRLIFRKPALLTIRSMFFPRKPALLQITSIFFPGSWLLLKEADSFQNSCPFFSRNLTLLTIRSVFFCRKRTSFKRSGLFSKFLSVFFQEPDSFENSFHVFPRKPALLQIRFIQSVTERPIPGPPSVRCSRWMGRPSGVGKRNNVTRNTASGLGKATRRGNHRLRASSRACSPVLEGSRQTVDVLSCLSGVETL